MILPTYSADHSGEPIMARIAGAEAPKALMANVTKLSRITDAEFAALCQLAERVPVIRVTHNDSMALAKRIIAGTVVTEQ